MSKKFFLLLCFLIPAISGCVQTAADRGVIYESPDRADRIGLQKVRILARLVDEKGLTVPGIEVYAETFHTKDTDVTNSQGNAILNLQLGEDEAIEFHFKAPRFSSSVTVSSLPFAEELTLIFVKSADRRIRLRATEF